MGDVYVKSGAPHLLAASSEWAADKPPPQSSACTKRWTTRCTSSASSRSGRCTSTSSRSGRTSGISQARGWIRPCSKRCARLCVRSLEDRLLIGLDAVQMSKEQLGQLYELMHATKGLWKPVEQLGKADGEA